MAYHPCFGDFPHSPGVMLSFNYLAPPVEIELRLSNINARLLTTNDLHYLPFQ